MRQETGFFDSFDQTKLFYRCWISEKPNPKPCLILHGYGEHSRRYDELVSFLQDVPYSFFSFDLRGQGRSGGVRVHADQFEDFVKDAETYLNFLQRDKISVNQKAALLGHSLGGLIAIRLALQIPSRFDKAILSSPFLGAHGLAALDLTFWLAAFLNQAMPKLQLPGPARPRYLFHDAEKMKQYLADTLIERRITARLGYELLRESRAAGERAVHLQMPLLVLASGDDRIVSLEKTKSWFEQVSAPEKEMKVYPDFYHEIFHETGRKEPMTKVKEFLEKNNGGM